MPVMQFQLKGTAFAVPFPYQAVPRVDGFALHLGSNDTEFNGDRHRAVLPELARIFREDLNTRPSYAGVNFSEHLSPKKFVLQSGMQLALHS